MTAGPAGGMAHGLYQCPSCGGPSHGPGDCRDCLAGSPAAGLIQWLPEDWRLTEPAANLAAAVNYMRHRYESACISWVYHGGQEEALLLAARIDFAVRRDGELTGDEQLARTLATPWCEPDGCPAPVCGGPHTAILVRDAELGEIAEVIVPAGASAADIEAALDYARHMYGPQEDGR